ncbi:MAG TPA: SUF system NifU family Fe-S cluster assembly protein [bacterium]|nr:SUF system NifU family Fe-S cluster assembly protein [bacterium]
MSLDELYRDVILDHYSHPRNRGVADPADAKREGANPLCGDEITVSLRVRDGVIEDVRFEGKGCSISQASASMMTEQLKGKPVAEANRLIAAFKAMMHIPSGAEPEVDEMGDLVALAGVRKFPVRVKCATLSWITLEMALQELGYPGPAATAEAGRDKA